jgi:D-alanine-D-alanine ligase-like ATP-grasp enzyme
MEFYERVGTPETLEHYPYVTRRLVHLYEKGALTNVKDFDIEPDYGYVARINYINGGCRITYGSDLGLNEGAACELAKDKGHTKFMLRTIGVEYPEGEEFLLPSWAEIVQINSKKIPAANLKLANEADPYIESHFGYPAYIKPVAGSKGGNIFKVYNPDELQTVLNLYEEKKVHLAIVEKPFDMPDYRVVMLDGELISAYQRLPLTVTGDGNHTVGQLLLELQEQYAEIGRDTRISLDDPRIASHLAKDNLTLDSRPDPKVKVVLLPVSNLSAGGTSVDVSDTIDKHWVELAAYVAKNFNLRLCGVDLACEDITDPKSRYLVIEVNAAPGLDNYAMSGVAQQKLVDEFYTKVFNALPGAPTKQ